MDAQKAIQALSKLGFEQARIWDDDVVAFFPDSDDQIVLRDAGENGIRAWVLKGPAAMPTPKSITYRHSNGCSPRYCFKSAREAGRLALENPHY